MKNKKLGFTLIELLIVIAILAILALGLMAALDPMEQLKKARDTATRNSVEEFYNAALRYNATKGSFPWGGGGATGLVLTDALVTAYVNSLISAGELKEGFRADTARLAKVFLTSTIIAGQMTDDLAVCFKPDSKAVKSEDSTKYSSQGVSLPVAGCANPTSTCYWCAK